MTSIAIITTCKGRLAFLKQTLPRMVATGFPVTVVDYDCPEGTRDWVRANFPDVNVVAVTDRPVFNHSEARNIGARSSASDALAFVDCDVTLSDEFADAAKALALSVGSFHIGDLAPRGELIGDCIIARRNFEEVGGYDEIIAGWGFEDFDLYLRLELRGMTRKSIRANLMAVIPHSHDLRVVFTAEKNMWVSHRLNRVYSRIKLDLEAHFRRSLTLTERKQIRKTAEEAVSRLRNEQPGKALSFLVPLGHDTFITPSPDPSEGAYTLEGFLSYTLSLG